MKKFTYLFFFLTSQFILFGLPEANNVLVGEVSFSEVNKQLNITASDGAIISYPSGFDVAAGETVQFIQPTSTARVLNQIYGQTPTRINGSLLANGHVYLLNSAGIIFGKNSVVEVGKLSAIAGTLSSNDFAAGIENFTGLSGSVENSGSIVAQEVVLAGFSVTNSGSILAENGTVVLAAGGGLSLYTEDSALSVVLSGEGYQQYPLMVSDVAGQALLQSGVVEASKAEFHGKEITVSGKTQVTDLTLGDFETVSGGNGSTLAIRLTLNGFNPISSPTVDLGSKSNQITELLVSGNFQSLKVRSSGELSVGDSSEPVNFSSQFLDLRVANGELTMKSLPSPLYSNQENSILLAADEILNLSYNLDQLTYSKMLLFGTNLTASNYQKIESKSENLYQLNATSLSLDDLTLNFSSASIQKLVTENPSFTRFSLEGSGILGLTSSSSEADSQSVDAVPSLSSYSSPSSSSFILEGTMPSFSPISISTPYESSLDGLLSDSALDLAKSYGLFANYSYYLKGPSTTERLSNIFASSGGSSALFGGSYNLLSSNSPSQQSESGSESESDFDSDSDSSSEEASNELKGSSAIKGAIPFAPISLPVSSPEAGTILDASLSTEIESNLKKYLD